MPNGHGGVPFLGVPILFAIVFVVMASLPNPQRLGWLWVAVCLFFAAIAGWRLAYPRHMRAADEYDGAYTSCAICASLRAPPTEISMPNSRRKPRSVLVRRVRMPIQPERRR